MFRILTSEPEAVRSSLLRMDALQDFQRVLAEYATATRDRDTAARERAGAILAEALGRHPEWKPLAPRAVKKGSTGRLR